MYKNVYSWGRNRLSFGYTKTDISKHIPMESVKLVIRRKEKSQNVGFLGDVKM